MDISENAKGFIFRHVDSVELLDVLLIFHRDENANWTVQALAQEMRGNPKSVAQRVQVLQSVGLIEARDGSKDTNYHYKRGSSDGHSAIDEIASIYKSHRHKIYELIFSPMKRARDFADAFRVGGTEKDRSKDE